jgi:signal transduction histidine kinase
VDLLSAAAADPIRPEPVRPQHLAALMTSIRRLEGLVESALTPARAEQHGALGLSSIADVLTDLPRPAPTGAAPIELRVTGRTDLVLAVEGDTARRALLPVLENAWRYAAREIRIDVNAVDGFALLAVSDDGGRLAAALTESVFTPGFRANPDDGYPGAGLGLALTRRICRAAGGDADAAIHDGYTTITLRLPCIPR